MSTEKRLSMFTKTVREREKSLYRVALVMLRNKADAEDAVSEGIEATFRHIDSLRDNSALPAYLMRCTIKERVFS